MIDASVLLQPVGVHLEFSSPDIATTGWFWRVMKEKLRVGDLCESQSLDIYLVLKTYAAHPTSILMIDSPKYHSTAVGKIFTQESNNWYLTKVSGTITTLEKLIYGVDLEV